MKRICTSPSSVCALFGTLSLALACSSGSDSPNAANANGTGGATGGATGGSSAGGASGAGGGSSTGGSVASGGGGSGGGSSTPSVCDNNVRELPLGEAFVDDFETDV